MPPGRCCSQLLPRSPYRLQHFAVGKVLNIFERVPTEPASALLFVFVIFVMWKGVKTSFPAVAGLYNRTELAEKRVSA